MNKTLEEVLKDYIVLRCDEDVAKLVDDEMNLITKKHIRLVGDKISIPGKVKCNTLIGKNTILRCGELECKYFEVRELHAKKINKY